MWDIIFILLQFIFLYAFAFTFWITIWQPQTGPPTRLPFVGHAAELFFLRSNLAQLLDRIYNQASTISNSLVPFYFARTKAYLVREPKIAKEVLTDKKLAFKVFGRPDVLLDPLLGHSSIFTDKNEWTHVKLDNDRLKVAADRMKNLEVELDQLLTHLIMENGYKDTCCEVDLNKLLPAYAAELMIRFGFGFSVYDMQALGISNVAEHISRMFQPSTEAAFRQTYCRYCPGLGRSIFRFYKLSMVPKAMQLKLWKAVESFWQEKDKLHPDCMLNWMAKDLESTRQLSTDSATRQVFNFFFEIYLTTVVLGSLVLLCLSKRPQVQQKLRQEISKECGVNTFNYETLSRVKYLDAVIKETLRTHPPFGVIEKTCRDRVTLRGDDGIRVTLQPGELLFIPVSYINRNPISWPDPTKFVPERFVFESDNDKDLVPFLPLDGSAMADFNRMALKVLIATFIQNFELLPPILRPQLSRRTMITCTEKGAWIKIKKRHVKKD